MDIWEPISDGVDDTPAWLWLADRNGYIMGYIEDAEAYSIIGEMEPYATHYIKIKYPHAPPVIH